MQYHPSTKACGMEGLDEWELTRKVSVPMLIMAAENDVDAYKPGNEALPALPTPTCRDAAVFLHTDSHMD